MSYGIHFIVSYTEYFTAVSLSFNFDFIALLFCYVFVSISFSVVLFCIFFLNHHKFHVWFYVYANYVLVLLEHLSTTKYYPDSWYLQYNPSQIIKWSTRKHKKHIMSQHDQIFCRSLFSHTNPLSATFTIGRIILLSIISSQNLHMSSGLWNVNLNGSRFVSLSFSSNSSFHNLPYCKAASACSSSPMPKTSGRSTLAQNSGLLASTHSAACLQFEECNLQPMEKIERKMSVP